MGREEDKGDTGGLWAEGEAEEKNTSEGREMNRPGRASRRKGKWQIRYRHENLGEHFKYQRDLQECGFSSFYNLTFQSLRMKYGCETDKQEKQGGQGRGFSICVGHMSALDEILYLNAG